MLKKAVYIHIWHSEMLSGTYLNCTGIVHCQRFPSLQPALIRKESLAALCPPQAILTISSHREGTAALSTECFLCSSPACCAGLFAQNYSHWQPPPLHARGTDVLHLPITPTTGEIACPGLPA